MFLLIFRKLRANYDFVNFKFHCVSINITRKIELTQIAEGFKFHCVSINIIENSTGAAENMALNSTVFLLISREFIGNRLTY